MGNLRSRSLVAERLWDWEFLNPCFAPTKIKPSDVDGEVERNGFFLRLEGKPVGFQLSRAQQIVFNRLREFKRASPNGGAPVQAFTIVVLYGEPQQPEYMQVWPNAILKCTIASVQDFVKDWFAWASSNQGDEIW